MLHTSNTDKLTVQVTKDVVRLVGRASVEHPPLQLQTPTIRSHSAGLQRSDGGTVLATVSLVSGKASFATTALALGSHSITASYGGATGYQASTSNTLTQTVH